MPQTGSTPARAGLIVLFGSGETSASGRKVCDWLLQQMNDSPQVSVLETPAGFEPNSAQVAGKVAEFFKERLQNYRPRVTVVPARKRNTPFSPNDPDIISPLLQADVIFLGPGSPTYAVRQLQDTLAWHTLIARHRLGTAVILASAATVAAGVYALPVYEIYKVGEDLHWHSGLDILGPYGLSLVFIPHWDNREGGVELDTSHCFMGKERFAHLLSLLRANRGWVRRTHSLGHRPGERDLPGDGTGAHSRTP
ncbi:MAG: cysteinyl-tRNA synthetase [Chloroflexi bacterium]|nr:cysteinyl-tRNA synthetase [Chloroflexota bacterium]